MEGGREQRPRRGARLLDAAVAGDRLHVEPVASPSADGRSRSTVHQVVRDLDGNVLSRARHHVYTLRDGLVARMDIVNRAEVARQELRLARHRTLEPLAGVDLEVTDRVARELALRGVLRDLLGAFATRASPSRTCR